MRLAAAAVTFLLLTGAAYAQPAINLWPDDKNVDPERAEKQREIDKAYREKIKNIPANAAPASNDPWGNVRASEKPAAPNKTQNGQKNR
jgi:hypothetical protein